MVFATLMVDGVKGIEDCPQLDEFSRKKLSEYLSQFRFMMGFSLLSVTITIVASYAAG